MDHPHVSTVRAVAAFLAFLAVGTTNATAQNAEPPAIEAGRVPPHGEYQPGFDALHYRVSLTLPNSGTSIRGRTLIDLAVRAPRRDTVWFDFTGMRVTEARVSVGASSMAAVRTRVADGRLYVPIPATAAPGDTLHVDIGYDGTPDDGLILRENVHGQRSVFADNWPDRARFWFPSIDHPSDKATAEFEVRTPAGWKVIGNGTRPDRKQGGERPADNVWRWSVAVPIPTYTMVIGAADFAVGTVTPCAHGGINALHQDGCVPVRYWVFRPDSAKGAEIFRRAGQMIEYYSSAFGAFPYEKLAHVQSATRFGGMENAGAIFYSEQAIARGQLGEGTVAHETVHQWFGDAVTESDWSHLWLSEGFATYFGMQFFEHADGVQPFRDMLANSRQGYLDSNVTDVAVVDMAAVPDNNLFGLLNANSYNKGGQILHMMRWVLGDDAFFTGIRRYFREHENGVALTADLQRAMEAAGGLDLTWFFQEWVYQPGHPIFRVAHRWDATSREAVVTVEQTQKAAWPAFRMPVEFEFETPQGTVRRKAGVSGRSIELRFPLPAAPSRVTLDPDGWLLKQMAAN